MSQNPTIDKLTELMTIYYGSPSGNEPLKQAIIAWALDILNDAIEPGDFTKEVKEYYDRVKAAITTKEVK